MGLGIGLALLNRRTSCGSPASIKRCSEPKKRASELATSNKQFLDLAEAIPQLVWISDNEGKPVYFNSPWGPFTGSTVEKLTRRAGPKRSIRTIATLPR